MTVHGGNGRSPNLLDMETAHVLALFLAVIVIASLFQQLL